MLLTAYAITPCLRHVAALAFIIGAAIPAGAFEISTLNPDGAWCWFQDERALMVNGNVVVSSITSTGTVDVTTYNIATDTTVVVPVKPGFTQKNGNPDDHNVAALLHRNDGHLVAFYARHHNDNNMFVRTSKQPDTALSWGPEKSFTFGIPNHATYANPFQLADESNRIYLFWRGLNFWPTFSYSDDGGTSWAAAKNIIADVNANTRTRPYAKYCSNNTDTIHIMYTDGHPRTQTTNSIYHIYYRAGHVYNSQGTLLNSLDSEPVLTTQGTSIYDGSSTSGKGWAWDIALDKTGNPVTVHATVPTESDHRYRYARWNPEESRWTDNEIAYAGTALYYAEREYSGGICLDPDDVSTVYISADVNPKTGEKTGTGKREIYRGKTADKGLTWKWTAITTNSAEDNIRPIVPHNHPAGTFVLWMSGRYSTYTNYKTRILLATDTATPL